MPPPAAEAVPRLDIRDPDVWLKALAWTTIVGSALLILTFSFGRDQGVFALVGRGLLEGKVPYRDLWDFKPPGIFFVYAAAQGLFGTANMMAPRLLEVLALFASVICLRNIADVFFENRTIGLVGGAVAALIHAQMDFWHSGQPETFGATATLVGIWLTAREHNGRRVLTFVLVGVTFGAAALLKPPLGGGALVCAAYLTQRERTQGASVRGALRAVAGVLGGFVLPPLVCVGWFWAHSALADLYWTLGEFTPGYTTLSWEGRRASDMLYYAIEQGFFGFSAIAAAGVIAAVAISPLHLREREGLFLFLGVIAVHLAGIAMQGKFYPYHYGATLPLIAAIAGLGLYKLWRRCLVGGAGGVIAFFSFVAIAVPMRYAVRDLPQFFGDRSLVRLKYLLQIPPYDSREEMDAQLAYVSDYNLLANREVAREVQAHTKPEEAIFVWGFEPSIYWLSRRSPGSRFIYNVPQRSFWQQTHARRELMRDLAQSRPALLVVQSQDVFPYLTGRELDSSGEVAYFPELSQLISSEYRLVKLIEDFEIYVRAPEL